MTRVGAVMLMTSVLSLGGCVTHQVGLILQQPTLELRSQTLEALQSLPPPQRKVEVSVYSFRDETGQYKSTDSFAEYSRAVTQGGAAILINALKEAGKGKWFTVVEREFLNDILQERQIYDVNRKAYLGVNGKPAPPLAALYVGGIILGGGIVGYDSDVLTGGAGARYLGIGASTQYRRDFVSVYLRAISTQTGQVLLSVVADKAIYSAEVQADLFKYVSLDKIAEGEIGYTRNEPRELAIKQAVEKAVRALIIEGAQQGYWSFANESAQKHLVASHEKERNSTEFIGHWALRPSTGESAGNRQ